MATKRRVARLLSPLALALLPVSASAQWPSLLQTRVRGSDQNPALLASPHGELSRGLDPACELSCVGIASDYAFAPKTTGAGKPQWLRDLEDGANFNRARTFDYPFREVYIERPGGGYFRLDAYDPVRGEIVSRKLTDLSAIAEQSSINYLNELARKYPPNARIANVPSSGPLAGQRLRGQMILEVAVQTRPIPRAVLDAAKRKAIVIRDVYGNVYN